MRLLYVTKSWTTHDVRFTKAWGAAGVDVRVCVAEGTNPEIGAAGAGAESLRARLAVAITEFVPDVIHAGPIPTVVPVVLDVWSGPLIAMSWGYDLVDEATTNSELRERARLAISRADLVLVDNDAPERVALELGADPERVRQFPWGVDVADFTPGRSDHKSWPSARGDELVILSTRRHEDYYDVETVVRAFILCSQAAPELRLLVAGEGSNSTRLRALVASAGCGDRVKFIGEIDQADLPDIYRSADLYVSASLVDGSSVSLLEAMASGVPVCVSNIEGNAQWIADGRGASFETGDHADLAQRMSSFVEAHRSGSTEWIDRAKLAFSYVHEHANWEKTKQSFPELAKTAIRYHQERK